MRLRVLFFLGLVVAGWWLVGRPGAGDLVQWAASAGSKSPGQAQVGASPGTRPVVVLSPGAGWLSTETQSIDAGATNAGLVEKDVTLDVAQQAQAMLNRCPVVALLTRQGDDKVHTLANVQDLVNADHPALAVALHSGAADAPSGTQAWYTVGGQDDQGSQRLAASLAAGVAARLSLANLGVQPETSSPSGGLYIHPWQAPAALVDLGSLGADSLAFRTKRREFARAVVQGVLGYLGLPAECADGTQIADAAALVAVTFPEQAASQNLTLQNDGLGTWDPAHYSLVAVGDTYGAAASYPLPAALAPGETATWALPARAPKAAGVYEQRWQLSRDGTPVGDPVVVLIVVVPPQAQALKDKLDQQVAEWQAAGAAKMDDLIRQMQQELAAWAQQETEKQAAKCVGVNGGLMIGVVIVAGGRRRGREKSLSTD